MIPPTVPVFWQSLLFSFISKLLMECWRRCWVVPWGVGRCFQFRILDKSYGLQSLCSLRYNFTSPPLFVVLDADESITFRAHRRLSGQFPRKQLVKHLSSKHPPREGLPQNHPAQYQHICSPHSCLLPIRFWRNQESQTLPSPHHFQAS